MSTEAHNTWPTSDADLAWLRRLASALVADAARADDLVQHAAAAAATSKRPIENLRGFLRVHLTLRARQLRREEARRREREERYAKLRHDETGGAIPGADMASLRVEAMRTVLDALEELPIAQRDAIALRFVDELPVAEIAARAGVAPGTIRGHISRGLATLRGRLNSDETARSTRFGMAGLCPWALLAPMGAPDPVPVVAGASRVAAVLLSLKVLLPVAAVLIGACIWWLQPGADVRALDRDVVARLVTSDVEGDMARVALDEQREPVRSALRVDAVIGGDEAGEATVPAAFGLSGQVVDRMTGEPVPEMDVQLQWGPRVNPHGLVDPSAGFPKLLAPVASPDAGHQTQTGADGTFVISSGRVPADSAGPFELSVRDSTGYAAHGNSTSVDVQRESNAPIEVTVGPTFRIASSVEPPRPWSDWTVRFVTGPDRGSEAYSTLVREGDSAWLRFPAIVTELDGVGPWTLEFLEPTGMAIGTATVDRHVGIEPQPIDVSFDLLGTIEFVASFEAGALAPVGVVHVVRELDGVELSAYLDRDPRAPRGEASSSIARLQQLRPGSYSWRRGGPDGSAGDVVVVAGERTVVEVMRSDAETFDVHISIDASELPSLHHAADLSRMQFRVSPVANMLSGFSQTPVPVAGVRDSVAFGPGVRADVWELRLDGLPSGTWNVVPMVGMSDVAWAPRQIQVTPGSGPLAFTVRPEGPSEAVSFRVTDLANGEPVPGVEIAQSLPGLSYTILRASTQRGLRSSPLPTGREYHAFVRAPGYQTSLVRFEHEPGAAPIEVSLALGWATSVRVLDTANRQWLAGIEVLVDGVSAGRTDGLGVLMLRGDAAPKSLALASSDYEVLRAPTPWIDGERIDPLVGHVFVVTRR